MRRLAAAWAASLFYLERALVAGAPVAWWRVGLALGLGAISKYSIGLLVPWSLIIHALGRPIHGAGGCATNRTRRVDRRRRLFARHPLERRTRVGFLRIPDFAAPRRNSSIRAAQALASALVLITPTGVVAIIASLCSAPGRPLRMATARRRGNGCSSQPRFSSHWPYLRSSACVMKSSSTGPARRGLRGCPVIAAGMTAAEPSLKGMRAGIRAAWLPTLVIMLLIYGAGLALPGAGVARSRLQQAP